MRQGKKSGTCLDDSDMTLVARQIAPRKYLHDWFDKLEDDHQISSHLSITDRALLLPSDNIDIAYRIQSGRIAAEMAPSAYDGPDRIRKRDKQDTAGRCEKEGERDQTPLDYT